MSGKSFTLPLLAAALAGASSGQSFESAREFIRRELLEGGAPSITVAVARKGSILWEEGFGWADREKRRPAGPHTMYSLASITKPMTATALMLLVQSGKVKLDAPVNDYLGDPGLRACMGDAREATVRRVANHSSGLPLHVHFFYSDQPERPPAMAETIRRYGILVSPPGEQYRYSNIGFGVLDYVISRVSGRKYDDFMREQVFVPLGLTHTSIGIGPGLEEYQAIRYGRDGRPIPFYDFDHRGASAAFASAHDLVRFGMFHLKDNLPDQKRILRDEWIDEMQRPTVPTGPAAGYGVGWATGERSGYATVSHGGAMGGVRNLLLLVPSEDIAVAVLCNLGNNEIPSRVADAIMPLLLPKWKPAEDAGSPHRFRPPADLAGTWSGIVATHTRKLPFRLRIFESGDVHGRLDTQLEALVNEPSFEDGRLTGRMAGDIGTDDAGGRQHFIALDLKLRKDVLNGSATAVSSGGARGGNALTSWVELKRESTRD